MSGYTRETDCAFLARVLADGQPHNLNSILRQSFAERGCGLTVHSRAADLRARGYDVRNWKDGERGNGSWYRLATVGEAEGTSAVPPEPSVSPTAVAQVEAGLPHGLPLSQVGSTTAVADQDGQLTLVGGSFTKRAAR